MNDTEIKSDELSVMDIWNTIDEEKMDLTELYGKLDMIWKKLTNDERDKLIDFSGEYVVAIDEVTKEYYHYYSDDASSSESIPSPSQYGDLITDYLIEGCKRHDCNKCSTIDIDYGPMYHVILVHLEDILENTQNDGE